jgi:hypothetical protein
MLIPVIKGKTPKETALAKGWDLSGMMPKLAKLSDEEQIVVIFACDPMNNPVYHLSKEDKAVIISEYFGIPVKMFNTIYDKCFQGGTKENEAAFEYISRMPDSVFNTYASLVEQNNSISYQIRSIRIDMDKLDDGTNKEFDRILKFQENALKVGDSIRKLEALLRSPEERHLFEMMVKKTKSALS